MFLYLHVVRAERKIRKENTDRKDYVSHTLLDTDVSAATHTESSCDHCDARPRYIDASFKHFRLNLSSISCSLHNVSLRVVPVALNARSAQLASFSWELFGRTAPIETAPRAEIGNLSRSPEINRKNGHSSSRVYLRENFHVEFI